MAKRRMLNIGIMTSDDFLKLSIKAQLIYLHLNLNADDDGLVGNPIGITRILGIPRKYLEELKAGGYIIEFSSGVVAVTHWHAHNQIRKDRYTESRYVNELCSLIVEKGQYKLIKKEDELIDAHFFGNQLATQDSLEKNNIENNNLNQFISGKNSSAEHSEGCKIDPQKGESGEEDDISRLADKTFKETLTEEQLINYNKFLYKVKLYFYTKHGGMSGEKFIEYNENRFWHGRDGVNVMNSFQEYADEWVRRELEYKMDDPR